MTDKQEKIVQQISDMISKGQTMSIMQKLEFDILISNSNELSNYILIVLILVESPNYNAEASDFLIRKIILNAEKFDFLQNKIEDTYSLLFENRILPYVGLSQVIRRLIASVIYKKEDDLDIISKLPSKEFLIDFNIRLIKDFFSQPEYTIQHGLNLLYNCWETVNVEQDYKVTLKRTAIEIFLNAFDLTSKYFDDYLHYFLRFQWYGGGRQWHEGKLVVPEPFYEQIFDSPANFLSFLDKVKYRPDRLLTDDLDRLYKDIEKFIKYYIQDGSVEYDDPRVNLKYELHYYLSIELKKG